MNSDSSRNAPAPISSRPEIDAFLDKTRALGPADAMDKRRRLIFALDATMSRQPTWDIACALQAEMFREAASVGGLDIQLVYFRGLNECRASGWVTHSERLAKLMRRIDCQGGHTQIGRVLRHGLKENAASRVHALIFVGDAMEEALDDLCYAAAEFALRGVPVFMFQEGDDPVAEQAYREVARLSHGAYARFDTGAAHELGELLRAAAAYATGGVQALQALAARQSSSSRKLLRQLG